MMSFAASTPRLSARLLAEAWTEPFGSLVKDEVSLLMVSVIGCTTSTSVSLLAKG